MNKNTISKLKLLFLGLKNRVEENREYFLGVDFKFKSGGKFFEGEYEIIDESMFFSFLGAKKIINSINIFNDILEVANQYEALEVVLKERGTKLIITADDKSVTSKQSESDFEIKEVSGKREYFISPNKAKELLTEINIMSKDGKIKNDMIRKYNQIDHFIEVILPILKELEDKESITILDCACGKSYLSFVLNYYIKEVLRKKCTFIGIDISEQVISSSKTIAKNLGYKNMSFINEDLRTYAPETSIDLTISLHACDIVTDYALATAVRLNSKAIVVVPCCHKELLEQINCPEIKPLYKHNIYKVRLNDFLTDALRGLFLESYGYEISPLEYISPLDTPKNLMIRAIKTNKNSKIKKEEYKAMKTFFSVNPTMDKYVW